MTMCLLRVEDVLLLLRHALVFGGRARYSGCRLHAGLLRKHVVLCVVLSLAWGGVGTLLSLLELHLEDLEVALVVGCGDGSLALGHGVSFAGTTVLVGGDIFGCDREDGCWSSKHGGGYGLEG